MEYISIKQLYSVYKSNPVISKDNRDVSKGCIYLALKGEKFDGNVFAKDAISKGAAYAIIDNPKYKVDDRYLLVEDCLTALQKLASLHREQLNIPIIGITGSNGKTTSKELISNVLKEKYKVHFTEGNYNNHIGVPLTLLQIREDIEIAVIEMGANHLGEIDSLCKIAQPTFGLITNIGKAHLEGFGGIEGIKKGKSELYKHLKTREGTIFLNVDDTILQSLAPKNIETVSYGKGNHSFCRGKLEESHPKVIGSWTCNKLEGKINSPLYGEYNFYNILAAICIGNYFKVGSESIDHAINSYQSEINRSQKVVKEDHTIYLDAYNANPTSMQLAIENFEKSQHPYKVAILGDMFELGKDSEKEHIEIINSLQASRLIQLSVFVGENFFQHRSTNNDILFMRTTEEARKWFLNCDKRNKAFLIKGSRGMKMETIIK